LNENIVGTIEVIGEYKAWTTLLLITLCHSLKGSNHPAVAAVAAVAVTAASNRVAADSNINFGFEPSSLW
jgi:hypothetical protein